MHSFTTHVGDFILIYAHVYPGDERLLDLRDYDTIILYKIPNT